ncbi:MAG: hypothetical protein OXM62_02570 [bacterium]|nr:hypothetical protein [bacterium]
MRSYLRVPSGWTERLARAGVEPGATSDGLVFWTDQTLGDEWEDVSDELTEAFVLTREAARAGAPVVYVVGSPDLLGKRGAGKAMVATGLLSAARDLAQETAKARIPANVLAIVEDAEPETVANWVARLLDDPGTTGELIRLGSLHLGKALP